eukprot:285456-Hanusia_phi.AAC.1
MTDSNKKTAILNPNSANAALPSQPTANVTAALGMRFERIGDPTRNSHLSHVSLLAIRSARN